MLRKRIVIGLASLALFIVTVMASFAYFTYHKVYVASAVTQTSSANPETSPTPTPDPLAPYNILLLGYGGGTHEGGELTDTMIVAHVIPKEKRVALISIPRDIWVPLPLTPDEPVYKKINHAYALGNDPVDYPDRDIKYQGEAGGATLAKDMVELVTGLPIRYFAVINFAGFEQAIASLGDVTVQVPVSFVDEFYPIEGEEENTCGRTEEDIEALTATMSGYKLEQQFPCRYERLEFKAGLQELDGATALKFVRSRHSETYGNDFSRSERQQALLIGVRDKLLSLGTLPKLVPLINSLSNNIRTDIGISAIRQVWSTHGDLKEFTFESITLNTDNVLVDTYSSDRQYILIPSSGEENWQQIHEFIQSELDKDKEATAEEE